MAYGHTARHTPRILRNVPESSRAASLLRAALFTYYCPFSIPYQHPLINEEIGNVVPGQLYLFSECVSQSVILSQSAT